MMDHRSPWLGAVAAAALFAVTAGPLILGAGWAALWSGASIAEGLGIAADGWRGGHAALLIWAGTGLAAPAAVGATVCVFSSALAAERSLAKAAIMA